MSTKKKTEYFKVSKTNQNLSNKIESSKEDQNINLIYDGTIKEKKNYVPSTSQTYLSTNGILDERDTNGNIIFNEENLNETPNYLIENEKTETNINIEKKRNYKRKRKHNEFDLDNIRSSIKNKFFNFIILFFNGFIKMLFENVEREFIWINYHDKQKISKNTLKKQFNMTMEEILKLDIQKNYTKHDKEHNKHLLKDILSEIKKNYSIYLDLFEMPLSEFYLKIFINGNRKDLETNYNLPKNALLLDEIILNLKKVETYKKKFKTTAVNLLEFSGIDYIHLDNKNKNFFNPFQMGIDNEINSSLNESMNIDECFLRKREREDLNKSF